MSKRPIDANELISAMYYYEHNEGGLTAYDAQDIINKAPTIEPKRGKWKIEVAETIYGKAYLLTCSECGETVSVTETALPYEHFCRNCGADMREREGE